MIKKATIEDVEILASLAVQMWDDTDVDDLKNEFSEVINNEKAVCFIKYHGSVPVAFAQSQLRGDYVEGTSSSPVGYLEGIYVSPHYRKMGYATELVSECISWARDNGCSEFASDCEIDNVASLNFHLAIGFEEVNRIICFRKKI